MIIKICGIQNEDTLICCEKNNVNFFGMIFYPKSPRNITIQNASNLQKISRDLKINGVGVFVNKNINEVEEIIKRIKLGFVQLHGSENDTYIKNIKKTGVKIIKSISISNKNDLRKIGKYKNVDYFLFDYKPLKGELPGGNAKSFDWDILRNLEIKKPWFLSGGINTDNIKQILKDINPLGIDLSSGVEKELGIKDNHIINNFIGKLKNV
ncbi:MAG: N-(5'-phosphoribosyl)anthranilate isomerase [Euryarchaeota archaeon]|nr:N-(5'-phosphoribosyl)anthranilate isomerase [Euryarchaeota archaeon]|tara:strand:- start:247 stop:876 length:630 start_codon:yes stop_codon:yes gene_type:complete